MKKKGIVGDSFAEIMIWIFFILIALGALYFVWNKLG